jgi:hypothetical protein
VLVELGGGSTLAERRLADLESTLLHAKIDPDAATPLLAALLDIPPPGERAPSAGRDGGASLSIVPVRASISPLPSGSYRDSDVI